MTFRIIEYSKLLKIGSLASGSKLSTNLACSPSHHTHSQKMKGLTLGGAGVGVPREPTPGEGVLIRTHKASPIFELVYTCHHKKFVPTCGISVR